MRLESLLQRSPHRATAVWAALTMPKGAPTHLDEAHLGRRQALALHISGLSAPGTDATCQQGQVPCRAALSGVFSKGQANAVTLEACYGANAHHGRCV